MAEPIQVCVQCSREYKDSENVEGSCNFHPAKLEGRGNSYPCCGGSMPCQRRKHRPEHHHDYPYAPFFDRASKVLNYSDTKETMLALEEQDMESGDVERCGVYKLLRWSSGGATLDEPLLLVRVGAVWYTSKSYRFQTWTENELLALRPDAAGVTTKLIHSTQTKPDMQSWSKAEFAFDGQGNFVGVRLSAKAASNAKPTVKLVHVNAKPLAVGVIDTISSGAFAEYGPSEGEQAYSLPTAVKTVGPSMDDGIGLGPSRPARTNFPAQGVLPLRMKCQKIVATGSARNDEGRGSDGFSGTLSLVSTEPTTPLVLMDVRCEWRPVGDPIWKPVAADDLKLAVPAPITCQPLQALDLSFELRTRYPNDDPDGVDTALAGQRSFERSFMAQARPLRFRFTAEGLSADQTASQVFEFVQGPPPRMDKRKPDDLLFLAIDKPVTQTRVGFHVLKSTSRSGVVRVGGRDLDEDAMRKLAFKGCRGQSTEIEIDQCSKETNDHIEKVWALVDPSCQRVYGIKALIYFKDMSAAAMGYAPVWMYGETEPKRPIALAQEQDQFKVVADKHNALNLATPTAFPEDDDFDDKKIDVGGGAATAGGTTGTGSTVNTQVIEEHLSAIDGKLDKMVSLFERLVVAIENKKQ